MAVTVCVLANDGFCCSALGAPDDAAVSVETACGSFITLPHGLDVREPTCVSCIRLSDHGAAR
jgi:hypothetical protein